MRKTFTAIGLMAAMVALGMGFVPGLLGTAAATRGGAPPAHAVNLIWANDELWNTVVVGPLHGKVPVHTLDVFYMIPGQNPVSEAAPGDADYNGGRWLPTMVAWVGAGAQPLFTDGEDVKAALMSGDLVVVGMGAPFLCPLTNRNA